MEEKLDMIIRLLEEQNRLLSNIEFAVAATVVASPSAVTMDGKFRASCAIEDILNGRRSETPLTFDDP